MLKPKLVIFKGYRAPKSFRGFRCQYINGPVYIFCNEAEQAKYYDNRKCGWAYISKRFAFGMVHKSNTYLSAPGTIELVGGPVDG